MTSPIFVDANVPMYAAGRPHTLKEPCQQILLLISERPRAFFTNSEVLQQLLHRYRAIRGWDLGRSVLRDFALLMRGRVEPVYAQDVEEAASLADRQPELSSRDLIHLAVMTRVGTQRIVSADRGFDRVPQVERLDPVDLAAWREQVQA
jgi:predicted nucleic acid-binding protein